MLVVKRILDESVAALAFPGAVLIIGDDHGIIGKESAGRLDFDPYSAEVRPGTIYDIASLTKVVVTTTLAMMLFEEGKLDLEEQVDEFTIRQLLTHSAGLPQVPDLEMGRGHRPPLQYKPGTEVLYSDVGFIILGRIIEQRAKAPLDVLAREQIFKPLGMNDTSFNPNPASAPRIAPTAPDVRGRVHDKAAQAMGGVSGHAGLFSTALDLAVFCQMLLRGGKTIELFTSVDGQVPGSTRALGWDTPSQQGSSSGHFFSRGSFGHTGFTGTSIWIDPVQRIYVIFLTNRVYPNSANLAIREIRPRIHDAVMMSLAEARAQK